MSENMTAEEMGGRADAEMAKGNIVIFGPMGMNSADILTRIFEVVFCQNEEHDHAGGPKVMIFAMNPAIAPVPGAQDAVH